MTRRPTQRRYRALGLVLVACTLASGTATAASLGLDAARLTVESEVVDISPTTCTLTTAEADSYVSELDLLSNFGAATTLEVRSLLLGSRRTFVRFDLTPCAIPGGALVTAAVLELFVSSAPPTERVHEVRRVSGTWTEAGITWTNQPAVAGAVTSTTTTGASGTWLSWSVTLDAQAFVDGETNDGWRISDAAEGAVTEHRAVFSSAESATASQRPVLTIRYFP